MQLSQTEYTSDENGKVCVKCEDLQRVLEENRKVALEFDKLTLEYEQLKLSFQAAEREKLNSQARVLELQEQQQAERAECDKLHKDLQALRDKLYDIQKDYERVNLDNTAKNTECMALNRQVELAREEMVMLQGKYNDLELSWQTQQKSLNDIDAQYKDIETKYKQLQNEYEQLEDSKGQSKADCVRLQKENVELQQEIENLKSKVQDVQQQLLESEEKTIDNTASTATDTETLLPALQKENADLKQTLTELQTQYQELQNEYEELSSQVLDNVQESEGLKRRNASLEEKIKELEHKCSDLSKAETEMTNLKGQMERLLNTEQKPMFRTPSPCHNSSMRSSGVCIEEEEFGDSSSDDLLKRFCELSEGLTQIELEHYNGKRKVFKTPTPSATPNFKLCLRNISGVSRTQKNLENEMENIHLQGSFKQHSFHIVELSSEAESTSANGNKDETDEAEVCANCLDRITSLKQEIVSLKMLKEKESLENKKLLENTESTLREMKEQISQLSAELLEKSMFVENCACKKYQLQIENLEKEKADITLVCEELQEKIVNCTFEASLINSTINADFLRSGKDETTKELEELRVKEKEMQETIESQVKMLEDLTQRNLDLESEYQNIKHALELQDKTNKEKCSQLELEMLTKLELSANEYRDNMKKYNREWEDRKEAYEATIKQLEDTMAENAKLQQQDAEKIQNLQEELNSLKQQFEELQNSEAPMEILGSNEKDNNGEDGSVVVQLREDVQCVQSEQVQQQQQRQQDIQELTKTLETLETLEQQANVLNNEKQEIDAQLQQTKMELQNLESQHKSLLEQKSSMEEESSTLRTQLAELQKNLADKDSMQIDVDALEKEKSEMILELNSLKQKLKSAEDQIKDYCTIDAEQEKTLHTLEEKSLANTCLTEDNLRLNEKLKGVQMELSCLSQKLQKLQDEKYNILQLLETSEELLKTKEKQLSTLQEEKSALKEKLQSLEALEEYNKQLQEKLKDFDSLLESKQELEQRIQVLEATETEQQNSLENKLSELDVLNEMLKQANAKILEVKENLNSELEETRKQNKALEEQLQQKLTEFKAMQGQIEGLDGQLQLVRNDKESLAHEAKDLKDTVVSLRQTVQALEQKEQSLVSSLKALTSSSNSLTLEKCSLEKEHLQCKEELQASQMRCNSLEQLLQQTTQDKNSLSTELHQLGEQKEAMERQLQYYQSRQDKAQLLEQVMEEKAEIEQKLHEANEKLKQQQETMDQLRDEKMRIENNLDMLKSALTKSNSDKQEMDKQLELFGKMQEEKIQLEATMAELKKCHQKAIVEIQEDKRKLQNDVQKYASDIVSYKEKEQTLMHKMNGMLQEVQEMRCKADALDKLQKECQHLQSNLAQANEEKKKLMQELKDFKASLAKTQEEFANQHASKIAELTEALQQSLQTQEKLRGQLAQMQASLQSETQNLEHQNQELKSTKAEMQLKYDALKAKNLQVQTQNQTLEQQLRLASDKIKDAESIQSKLSIAKAEYEELKAKMKETMQTAERNQSSLQEELTRHKQMLESQKQTHENMQKEMTTKANEYQLEKATLTSTINDLQSTCTSLEEKIREIISNNFKNDLQRHSGDLSNTSLDGSSTHSSPRGRRSMNVSIEDKFSTNQARMTQQTAERKTRRSNYFNERRQSYWAVTQDRETMTDPVDKSCNCLELDGKLKECEKKLFIRESQVTALSMELKNHPLKDENAALVKRLQEEQDKCRNEIKRYKQKLYEQTSKAEKALAAAATAASAPSNSANSTSESETPKTPKVLLNADTQTDCELSNALTKLQGKYNDIVQICRFRMTMIKELEERIAQKENTDGNARDCGHSMLQSKYDSLTNEIKALQTKYELAKQVLHSRRQEIQRLRSQLEDMKT